VGRQGVVAHGHDDHVLGRIAHPGQLMPEVVVKFIGRTEAAAVLQTVHDPENQQEQAQAVKRFFGHGGYGRVRADNGA
jgi:hypothetical protein